MSAAHDRAIPLWGAIGLLLFGAVIAVLALVGVAAFNAAVHALPLSQAFARTAGAPLNVAFAQTAGAAVAILAGRFAFDRGAPLVDLLGLGAPSTPVLGLAVVAGLGLQFPLAELGNLLQHAFPVPVEHQAAVQRLVSPSSAADALVAILAVVVVPPITEELFFRGLVLRGLARRHGVVAALVLSSALFGLSHGMPSAVLYAAVAGVALGWVAVRTGSTWASVAMHGAVNAVPLLLPERVVAIPGFNGVSAEVYHLPLPIVIGGAVVAAAAMTGIARLTSEREP